MNAATKMLSLNSISFIQHAKMKHALGLDYKNSPTRNYYYASSPLEIWEDLVDKGFATKKSGNRKNSVYYYVTYEGVKLLYRKNITRKYYEEL